MLTDELATTTDHAPPEAHPTREEETAPPAAVQDESHAADLAAHALTQEEAAPARTESEVAAAETPTAHAEAEAEAEASAPAPEAEPAEQKPNNKRWYVVKVQSGREETIRDAIERKVKIEGLEEYFGQIYIPSEKVTEVRNSKRYTREKKILPGYIMAEVEYNDRILYLFRETSGVGDFVGAQPLTNRPPVPMSQREVDRWMKVKPTEEDTKVTTDLEKGDRVRVKDGMFAGMEGEVKEILEAKNSVKVELTIFGRPVVVEHEYWQVEHV